MKELSIEEKAKAYDEALWKAGELYQPSYSALLEEIFPELIKYNNEKVRGAIIHFISHTPTVPKGRINKETMLAWLEKQGKTSPILSNSSNTGKIEQKPWSEEDEKLFNRICDLIHGAAYENCETDEDGKELGEYAKMMRLLKSLKDRVQPKQEWIEKDEKTWEELIEEVKDQIDSVTAPDCRVKEDEKVLKQLNKWLTWLNSLKDRYTWKPTEEQMKALSNALSLAKNCGEESAFDLSTLYEQLKRL